MAGWDVSPALFADHVEEELVDLQKVIVISMITEVIKNAPVDHGEYMANNFVSVASPSYDIKSTYDLTGEATKAAARAALVGLKPFNTVFVQNNVPYGEIIEFGGYNGPTAKVTPSGYSRMSPQGVYGISIIAVAEKLA